MITVICALLAGDALRVRSVEHRALAAFGRIQGIDEAEAIESLPKQSSVGWACWIFERRAMAIGQQHHLVGPELALSTCAADPPSERDASVHDAIARTRAGIGDKDVGWLSFLPNWGAKDLGDLPLIELRGELRRIDDAVAVRGLAGGRPVKEPLVDGIQEVLLSLELRNGMGGALDGNVKGIEALEVLGTAEAFAARALITLLDLGGDGGAACRTRGGGRDRARIGAQ